MEQKLKTLSLEKRALRYVINLPKGIHDLKFETKLFDYARELGACLSAFVLTEHVGDAEQELTFAYPKNWWHHLKKNLGWNYEVQIAKRTAKFEQRAYYPHAEFKDVLGSPVIKIESYQL